MPPSLTPLLQDASPHAPAAQGPRPGAQPCLLLLQSPALAPRTPTTSVAVLSRYFCSSLRARLCVHLLQTTTKGVGGKKRAKAHAPESHQEPFPGKPQRRMCPRWQLTLKRWGCLM